MGTHPPSENPIQGPADGESDWHPELVEKLYEILYAPDMQGAELDVELQKLEQTYHDAVYAELIHLLSHLRFEPKEAKQHWQKIVGHRDVVQSCLGSRVDLRVALVSYFVQVNRMLKNPKVIELQLFEETRDSVYRDELSGLHNYRFFNECLARELKRSDRYNSPLSLVMIDIDDFKLYNDQNGHEAGNAAIAAIARVLKGSIREIDFAVRYGGEEFALILPMTPKPGARLVAERAKWSIDRRPFPQGDRQPKGKLTVSMGIATYPGDAAEGGELVRRADYALYMAKAHGKNIIELYGASLRSYRRIKVSLGGEFRMLGAEPHPLTTLNVSGGGVLFLANQSLPVGCLIEISLGLAELSHEITMTARVVHVKEKPSQEFEVGTRIVEIAERDRKLLEGYVRELDAHSGVEQPQ
jgi:diguanylate cyclase (GGDEF)-like protein